MGYKDLAKSLGRKEVLLPYLKQFLTKERACIEAGKTTHAQIVVQDADLTIKCFTERKTEYNHKGTEIPGIYFHPSRLGACMRQLFFGAMDAPVNDSASGESLLREVMIFETGTYLGVFIQNLCERSGCLEAREVPIQNAKLKILGHADGVVKIGGKRYLLELKTINARGFAMTHEPKQDHIKQVHAYMKGLDLDCALIVYYNKDTHHLKEFVVPFDEDIYLHEVRGRIDYFFKRLKKKRLPPREGASVHGFPCSFCAFSRVCWETMMLKKWMTDHKVKHTSIPIPIAPLKQLANDITKL